MEQKQRQHQVAFQKIYTVQRYLIILIFFLTFILIQVVTKVDVEFLLLLHMQTIFGMHWF